MTELNPHIIPPGGFSFTDENGMVHTATTFEKLKKQIATHREHMGQPTGDPHREVTDQIVKRCPWIAVR